MQQLLIFQKFMLLVTLPSSEKGIQIVIAGLFLSGVGKLMLHIVLF